MSAFTITEHAVGDDARVTAFIDSTPTRVLAGGAEATPGVGRIEIIGVEDVIPLPRSRDDAIAALARAA
jgi:hypothetical protein